MSQTKVQLIQPIGIMTAPGVNVSGTLTATTFDGNLVGEAGSIIGTPNVNAGIFTATSFYGSGSGLSGVPSGPAYVGQSTAAQSGTTTIDLSTGNVVYFTQDTNTTVAFANTESVQEVRFIRVKDDTTTARTITWPASIIWNGGTAPTLIDSDQLGEVQIFNLTTRDQGVTWYGYEAMKNDPSPPTQFFAWGRGGYGGLLQNGIPDCSSPTQIPGTQWSKMYPSHMGEATYAAQKTDGTLWVWGKNDTGFLGQNDIIARSSPVQIPGTQWNDVAMGYFSLGTKTDGTLWVWGSNLEGSLGLNQASGPQRSSPTQIPGTQWNKVGNGTYAGFATKTDGTLWAWGRNGSAQFGINNKTYYSSPKQIPGTQWSSITSSTLTFGLKSDGTLWAWSNNGNGGAGQNNTISYSSPRQIPGTQWSKVNHLGYGFMAQKTDGTLWGCGYNQAGRLGQNLNVPNFSSPRQIPGTQWDDFSSTNGYTIATKTDGTLWSWGANNYGTAGQNNVVDYSSPIQIPGTPWSKPETPYRTSFAFLN
jgi:alpha-tubulin suppressor-like RCC1 family protein